MNKIDFRQLLFSRVMLVRFGALLLLILVIALLWQFSQRDVFGWRLNVGLFRVETKDYVSLAPNLAFRYPAFFELDLDPEKRYGKEYVVGIKLKTDERTGCDIRRGGPVLDYAQGVDVAAASVIAPIREKATDFKLLEQKKELIGGRDAFFFSFSFLDPIGSRVRLDQLFVSGQESPLMILCGTGEYQYQLFEKDFHLFYDSISFQGDLPRQ